MPTVVELREELRRRGLKVSGVKSELERRLRELTSPKRETVRDIKIKLRERGLKTTGTRSALEARLRRGQATPIAKTPMGISHLRVPELKTIARERGLQVSKKRKAELVAELKALRTKTTLHPTPTPPKPKPLSPASVREHIGCIPRSRLALRDHQIRVVKHLEEHRGLIVSHGTGSGKTLTAITASQCFLDADPEHQVVVVTPVSLQDNMIKEMKAYGVKNFERYSFFTLQKFANTYADIPFPKNTMLIIDEAHNLRTLVEAAKTKKSKKSDPLGEAPRKSIQRADVAIKAARTATKVLLLTATAVYNSPYDLANLVAMVRGHRAPTPVEFERIAASPRLFDAFFKCCISFYHVPKTIETEYPTVKEYHVQIPMTHQYYREYRNVEQRNSKFFSKANPWRFLTGMRQATNVLDVCDKCKWILNKLERDPKPTVIYSAFLTNGVRQIQGLLRTAGIAYAEVTGKTPKVERARSVARYNSGSVPVLFITKAGGEGLDLKNTRTVIIMESGWNRATEVQVIGRAARFRSHAALPMEDRKVDVYFLLMVKPTQFRDPDDTRPSADELLKDKIMEKEAVNTEFLQRLYEVSIEQAEC